MPSLRLVNRFLIALGANVYAPSNRPDQNATSAAVDDPDNSSTRPAPNATPERIGSISPGSRRHERSISPASTPEALFGSSHPHAALITRPPAFPSRHSRRSPSIPDQYTPRSHRPPTQRKSTRLHSNHQCAT